MKIQRSSLVLLVGALLAIPAVCQEPEIVPMGEMAPLASPMGEEWVSDTPPMPQHEDVLVSCPHCSEHDCCKVVPVQEIRWKYVMYDLKITSYQVEETCSKLLKSDKCKNGVCTQIDQLVRTKELVPHPDHITVPGLKPYTVTVPKKLCFKCKRTH